MGDVGEDYKTYNQIKKDRREQRLKENIEKFSKYAFTKHTDYHWSIKLVGGTLNFYPSKNFGFYKNARVSMTKIEDLLSKSQKEGSRDI